MKTLFEQVTESLDFSARKHDLGESFTEDYINKMSNIELLRTISDALEILLTEFAEENRP